MTADQKPFFRYAVKNQPSGVLYPFDHPSQWVEDAEDWQDFKDKILQEWHQELDAERIPEGSICYSPVTIRKWGYSYLYQINLYGNYRPVVFGITSKVEPDKEPGVYQEEHV